jgi:uncharacterized protein DUF4115
VLALAAIGALALAGAVAATVTWRRGMDERQSVKEYHSTLETLRHVSDRVEPTRSRPATNGSGRAQATRAGAAPARSRGAVADTGATTTPAPARARQRPSRPVIEAPATADAGTNGSGAVAGTSADRVALVFDDAAPAAPAATADPEARRAIARMGGARSATRPTRGNRTVLTTAAAVVAVAVLAVVAVVLVPSHSPPRASSTRSTPRASTHSTSPAPTTAPGTVQPSVSSASSATYGAPTGAFDVVLSATGLCWVMAVDQGTGKVVWTGTMTTGQSQSIPASGQMKVTLGAASDVTMRLGGKTVVLPTGYQSPFVATFAPGT